MTSWKTQRRSGLDSELQERLGAETVAFLKQGGVLMLYLWDYVVVREKLHSQMKGLALHDNSLFALPACKLFEGALRLIAVQTGWAKSFGGEKSLHSVRFFFRKNRNDIEADIRKRINDDTKSQEVIDKLFSTVNDFRARHEAVHSGSLLNTGDVENYDAVVTKIKEIVLTLLEVGLLDIGDAVYTSSNGETVYKK